MPARAAAVATGAALALCATASAGQLAQTPDGALAASLKASMKAFYAKSVPDLALTTVRCVIAAGGTTAHCQAHFTIKPASELGVFRVSATIDRSTGGVRTKTLSAACTSTKTGKPVTCRY